MLKIYNIKEKQEGKLNIKHKLSYRLFSSTDSLIFCFSCDIIESECEKRGGLLWRNVIIFKNIVEKKKVDVQEIKFTDISKIVEKTVKS